MSLEINQLEIIPRIDKKNLTVFYFQYLRFIACMTHYFFSLENKNHVLSSHSISVEMLQLFKLTVNALQIFILFHRDKE